MRLLIAVISLIVAFSSPLTVKIGVAAKPTPTPSPPPSQLVTQLCVPSGTDETVSRWNFIYPYLVCFVSDANAGTSELFKQTGSGTYQLVSHGGGDMPAVRLEAYGVPSTTATALLAGLHP